MVLLAVVTKESDLLMAHLLDTHLLTVYPSSCHGNKQGGIEEDPSAHCLLCETTLRGMKKMDDFFAITVAHKALVTELATLTINTDDHMTKFFSEKINNNSK